MALTILQKANVRVFEDSAKQNCFFGPADKNAELTIDGMERHQAGSFELVASPTVPDSITLSLGDISDVRGLYLKVDGECEVTINGVGPVTLSPGIDKNGAEVSAAKLVADYKISSVVVNVPAQTGGKTVVGSFCVWGDPVAAP